MTFHDKTRHWGAGMLMREGRVKKNTISRTSWLPDHHRLAGWSVGF